MFISPKIQFDHRVRIRSDIDRHQPRRGRPFERSLFTKSLSKGDVARLDPFCPSGASRIALTATSMTGTHRSKHARIGSARLCVNAHNEKNNRGRQVERDHRVPACLRVRNGRACDLSRID
jgi:hypothetical protein